jgi:hypothetical protein
VQAIGWQRHLPRYGRGIVKVVKSVNLENDEHENEQIQRGRSDQVPKVGGSRRSGQENFSAVQGMNEVGNGGTTTRGAQWPRKQGAF